MIARNDFPSASDVRVVSPPQRAAEVVPSDTDDLPHVARALYVGGEGDVRVTTVGGDTVTLAGLSGQHVLMVSRVWATGTTATGIVAEW